MRTFTFLLILTVVRVGAQDYNASLIPSNLKEGANVVYRLDAGHFRILSIDKAEYISHEVVTVLNERGKEHGYVRMFYDKLSSIADIEVNLYDRTGKRIKKYKSSDLKDVSAYSDNLFDDSRVKYLDVEYASYPYSVEIKYTKKYKYLYTIPQWFFQGGEGVSMALSKYTLEFPVVVGARYKEQNFTGTKTESEEEGIKIIEWTMTDQKAMDPEPYGPPAADYYPNILPAVSRFSFEGYEGDLSTWDGMARWQLVLNEDREGLPEGTVSKIQKLTDGLDRKEKIRKVYEYVQQNTRYLSVQLGVGGFQPIPAKVVDETGYGDCKALSFYTQSLLKSVGIDSYYTWVYGGSNPPEIDPDFPKDSFNHIILAVPHEKDTIWLECTSQTNPFGYQGTFTGDRKVLLINEEGGHLVNTTSYPRDSNGKKLRATIRIDEEGHAMVESRALYQGTSANRMLSRSVWSKDDQEDYLEETIDIPTFEIRDFSLDRVDEVDVEVKVSLWVNKLLSKSGTRLFLEPNVTNKNRFVPLKNDDRKTDVIVRNGFHEYDTIKFELPMGYRIEAKFDPIVIESDFGEYRAEIVADEDGKFQYLRHFMQKEGRYEAAKYGEYLEFHKEVVRADKRKIALISGT